MTRYRGTPLHAKDVSVRFGGLQALDSVSLEVPNRGIVGLIGPNGAGKTTLFDAVTGVNDPTSGRILLFGRDVTGWPAHRRARLGVGRTFQRLELFGSLTALENLIVAVESEFRRGGVFSDLFALPESVETRADAADHAQLVLEKVGLGEYAHMRAGDLPIGLARMVELGRALCTFPRLLLLDEISSGLSPEESRGLAVLIRGLRDDEGKSILVVEHDMPFVLGLCDYVYVLDFGKLIAEGTPEVIRRDPAVQAAYLGQESEELQEAEGEAVEETEDAAAPRG